MAIVLKRLNQYLGSGRTHPEHTLNLSTQGTGLRSGPDYGPGTCQVLWWVPFWDVLNRQDLRGQDPNGFEGGCHQAQGSYDSVTAALAFGELVHNLI